MHKSTQIVIATGPGPRADSTVSGFRSRRPAVSVQNASATFVNARFENNTAETGSIYLSGTSELALNNVTFSGSAVSTDVTVRDSNDTATRSRVFVSQPDVTVSDGRASTWPNTISFGKAASEGATLLLEDDPWLREMMAVRARV